MQTVTEKDAVTSETKNKRGSLKKKLCEWWNARVLLRRVLKLLSIVFGVLLVLVIIDAYDLPSKIGIPMSNVNYQILSLFVGNGVSVTVFYLGYQLVDKKKNDKEANKKRVALMLFLGAYEHCKTLAKEISKDSFFDDVKPLVDETTNIQDPIIAHYRSLPFANCDRMIATFAQNGDIDDEQMRKYIDIQRDFGSFVDTCFLEWSQKLLDDIDEDEESERNEENTEDENAENAEAEEVGESQATAFLSKLDVAIGNLEASLENKH